MEERNELGLEWYKTAHKLLREDVEWYRKRIDSCLRGWNHCGELLEAFKDETRELREENRRLHDLYDNLWDEGERFLDELFMEVFPEHDGDVNFHEALRLIKEINHG